jgi:hypothetical protein
VLLTIDANHSDMCKFSGAADNFGKFGPVISHLTRLAKSRRDGHIPKLQHIEQREQRTATPSRHNMHGDTRDMERDYKTTKGLE